MEKGGRGWWEKEGQKGEGRAREKGGQKGEGKGLRTGAGRREGVEDECLEAGSC